MAQRQIDKRLAAQLLESTKSVLDHVSRWMMELNQTGKEPPDGLARVYGRARRLRDYLHRSAAAYGTTVSLDLSDDDEDLLVSCIVHHLGVIESELNTGQAAEQGWLEEELKSLGQCAIDLATRPVHKIPTQQSADQTTPTVRAVMSAISRKTAQLVTDAEELGAHAASGLWPTATTTPSAGESAAASTDPSGLHPSAGMAAAPPSQPPSGHHAAAAPQAADAAAPAEPRAADPGFEIQRGPVHPFQMDQATATSTPPPSDSAMSVGESGMFQIEHGSAYPSYDNTSAAGATLASKAPRPQEPQPVFESKAGPPLLDPARVTDPRLRTMITMDQRAFDNTMAAEHYRLAMVHLSSVFEAAVVDYALPRQKDLGIKGPPETWRIERVLDAALAERLNSRDRPYLLQLVAARHLVRPAVQLMSPMVVTSQTLERVINFVRRVLVELGYAGSASAAGEDEFDLSGGSGLMASTPPPSTEAPAPPRLPPRPNQGPGAPTYP